MIEELDLKARDMGWNKRRLVLLLEGLGVTGKINQLVKAVQTLETTVSGNRGWIQAQVDAKRLRQEAEELSLASEVLRDNLPKPKRTRLEAIAAEGCRYASGTVLPKGDFDLLLRCADVIKRRGDATCGDMLMDAYAEMADIYDELTAEADA